eukprot:g4286.t1
MKGVMAKHQAAHKKFAMEQAKARMFLLQNGTDEQQKAVQAQLKLNQDEINKLKTQLAQKGAQKALNVDNDEIKRLKAELAKKGGPDMNKLKQKMKKELLDEFEIARRNAVKEVEDRKAEEVKALTSKLNKNDVEMKSMKERLEQAEKAAKSKKQSEDEASKRAQNLALQASQSEQQVKEMQEKLARKEEELKAKAAELDKIRAGASSKEAKANAIANKLAQEKRDLEANMQSMKLELTNLKDENKKLKRDYLHEQHLRRKYHNELEDMKGAIRVFCRTRPLSGTENEKGCKDVTEFPNEFTVAVTDEDEKVRKYEFDKAFGPNTSQEDIFADTKRLIQSAVDGYNVCIFAYGQTGSGKTYTMMGPSFDDNPGLIPRTVKEIFRIQRRDANKIKIGVKIYMVELYRDKLVDLLSNVAAKDQPSLNIKKDARGIVYVEDVTIRECRDKDMLIQAINDGQAKRKVASTQMNSESSRSHLIMSIIIECTDLNTKVTNVGKISLVDLAGSERVGKTGATADRLKEAQAINKSLSALGDVISSLTTNEKHIPYRNHKLTMLLSDSLGGNAKTLMFVNASPADYNTAETNNALKFATRVKKVVNQSSKTVETKQIKLLKEQLRQAKEALAKKK